MTPSESTAKDSPNTGRTRKVRPPLFFPPEGSIRRRNARISRPRGRDRL